MHLRAAQHSSGSPNPRPPLSRTLMRAQAILGPGAGESDLRRLCSAGLSVDSSREFRCEPDVDLVIVAGGDGTVHRFLPELMLCGRPILVVPCGSGNDLARALAIRSIADAVSLARDFLRDIATVKQIDIGTIIDSSGKETPFCCTAGVGLDAIAAQCANRMPQWLRAHGGYLIAALNGILLSPKIELTAIFGAGEIVTPIKRSVCLFTVANTPSFGGGLPIAPAARLDDGEFDSVFADTMRRARLARASLSLLKGTHLDLPEVHFMRVASITLESDPPVKVYADGEFVCETPIRVRVLPAALRVLSGTPEQFRGSRIVASPR